MAIEMAKAVGGSVDSLYEAQMLIKKIEDNYAEGDPTRDVLLALIQDNINIDHRIEGLEDSMYRDDRDD